MRLPLWPILALTLLASCATTGRRPGVLEPPRQDETVTSVEQGAASFYASRFQGRRTANGERYDESELTAAHRTLPFGTRVRVTHLANERQVVVRINDRGPHIRGRIIDLSLEAAKALKLVAEGAAPVLVEVLGESTAAR